MAERFAYLGERFITSGDGSRANPFSITLETDRHLLCKNILAELKQRQLRSGWFSFDSMKYGRLFLISVDQVAHQIHLIKRVATEVSQIEVDLFKILELKFSLTGYGGQYIYATGSELNPSRPSLMTNESPQNSAF